MKAKRDLFVLNETRKTVQSLAKIKYGEYRTYKQLQLFREKADSTSQPPYPVPAHETLSAIYYGKRLLSDMYIPFFADALGVAPETLQNIEANANKSKKRAKRAKIRSAFDQNISGLIHERQDAITRAYYIMRSYGYSVLLFFQDENRTHYVAKIQDNKILMSGNASGSYEKTYPVSIPDLLRFFDSAKLEAEILIGTEQHLLKLTTITMTDGKHLIRLSGAEIFRFVADLDAVITNRVLFWSQPEDPDSKINILKLQKELSSRTATE